MNYIFQGFGFAMGIALFWFVGFIIMKIIEGRMPNDKR